MKKILLPTFTCLFFALFFISSGCMTNKKLAKLYIENDSTSVYSTHPSRPFKYGFPISREQCEDMRNGAFGYYNIQKGDVVADVGAASGWLDGAFSVLTDSVTYYVQDVDTHFLSHDQLDKVVKYFSSLRSTPQTNRFHMVIGTSKKTHLPDSTFDKIIIHNTFHEFMAPWRIVQDLKSKLKPNGKIYVYDLFSNYYKRMKHGGCDLPADKAYFVYEVFLGYDLYLTNMANPENAHQNYLTFEADQNKGDAFAAKQKTVETYIAELDKLNLPAIYSDSVATARLAYYLKEHLTEIHTVYPSLEDYVNALGYRLLKEKQYLAAIYILKVNSILYPASFNTWDSLGEAYLRGNNYRASLSTYQKALELKPEDPDTKETIRQLTDSLSKKNF